MQHAACVMCCSFHACASECFSQMAAGFAGVRTRNQWLRELGRLITGTIQSASASTVWPWAQTSSPIGAMRSKSPTLHAASQPVGLLHTQSKHAPFLCCGNCSQGALAAHQLSSRMCLAAPSFVQSAHHPTRGSALHADRCYLVAALQLMSMMYKTHTDPV